MNEKSGLKIEEFPKEEIAEKTKNSAKKSRFSPFYSSRNWSRSDF
jgi:hypothetical protein